VRPAISDEDLDAIQRQLDSAEGHARGAGRSARHLTMIMALDDVQGLISRIRIAESCNQAPEQL
jgi:hypothetical protein